MAAVLSLICGSQAVAQGSPASGDAWNRYISAVERERANALQSTTGGRFLAMDVGPRASADRRAVLAGEVVVESLDSPFATGQTIEVPGAMVHRWRGAVLVPNVTVAQLLQRLEAAPPINEDVLGATVLRRGRDEMHVFLRLQRRKIVTVVYNTEHDVHFERLSSTRAVSTSVATRIAEVRNPGEPGESEYAPGDDHGFLWRLNAYWRYEQAAGGVIAECESISLSRSVPMLLRPIAGPIVNGVARESLERTLNALRAWS